MNGRMRLRAMAAIGFLSLGLGSTARGTMIYTDQATFLANVQAGSYLESFDSLAQGTLINSPLAFSQDSFAYTASVAGGFYNVGPPNDVWLSTNNSGDPIVFNFSSGNINAVGGYFFVTDYYGDVTTGTVTVALDNGATYSITDASSTSFIGFTTSAPILSLSVTADASTWATANDFIVGTASVPEPSSLILLGLGTTVVLASKRLGLRNGRAARSGSRRGPDRPGLVTDAC